MDQLSARIDAAIRANVEQAALTHLSLQLAVDFERRVLSGCALWTCELKAATAELVFDTKKLSIERVTIDGAPAEFSLGDEHEAFGQALSVALPPSAAAGATLKVAIYYATSPESSALQWLPKECTAGKKLPYLFSQCQAIHARALVPCADTPSAKFTYDAEVAAPEWSTALMSAISTGVKRKGGADAFATKSYTFEQTVPIPSYLLCLAVGQLEARSVGPRSQVWSEPSMVGAVAHEFAETEKFIAMAEEITGHEYVWKRYDILCLPPSFPYGGMENPCLTFVTPTLLAGDRSLADVVAHEVSHSWTGNLITNHTWEHFWLNEGWTVWLERKIKARMAGKDDAALGDATYDFAAISGRTHLQDDIGLFGADNALTNMCPPGTIPNHRPHGGVPPPPTHPWRPTVVCPLPSRCPVLRDVDPDDAFSSVPYEKGFNFLHYLGTVVGGRVAFEGFAKDYVRRFAFKTLTSADFKAFFLEWCAAREIDASGVEWQKWLLSPGMPPVTNAFSNELGEECTKLADAWLGEAAPAKAPSAADVAGWSTAQYISFLEYMISTVPAAGGGGAPPPLAARLGALDEAYALSASRNSEVRFRWQRLCIKLRADFIVPQVIDFLKSQGRMKFTRPLYRDLAAWAEQKQTAVDTFTGWAENYHPICRKMVATDLGVAK